MSSSRSPTSGWATRPARPSSNRPRRFPSRHRAASPARRRAGGARAARPLVSAVSTVVVLGLLVTVVVTSEGWPNVRETFFSPTDFADAFPAVLEGFWLDVKLFMVVEVAVLVLGLVVALARISQTPALFPLRLLAAVFVDVLRGVPTILVVYLIGFGVPALMLSGVPTDPVVLGGIALTLAYSAYVGEVYRAGIESVHPSQRSAALAVGLTEGQAHAPRGAAAGGPPRRAAAAQRLHLAPEGRRARLDPRSARGVPRRPDRGVARTSSTRRWSPRRCSTSA